MGGGGLTVLSSTIAHVATQIPPNTLTGSWIPSNTHPIIERVRFPWPSVSSCLSCLSMFNYVENRFNGTRSLFPTGHGGSLFHSPMVRAAGRGRTCPKCRRLMSKARLGSLWDRSVTWGQVDPPSLRAGHFAGPNQPLCRQPVGDMREVGQAAMRPVSIANG